MIKNAFYFTLKTLFVLKIFKFLFWYFGQMEKGLIRKIRLIWKPMTPQPGKQTTTTHVWQIYQDVKAIKQWNFFS